MRSKPELDPSLVAERIPVDELPVIDFGEFLNGDTDDRRSVATRLAAACRQTGFLYITGHGVPDHVVAQAFQASAGFFALPVTSKGELTMDNSVPPYSGWRDFTAPSSDDAGPGDLKEIFRMGLMPDEHPSVLSGEPMALRNQWPGQPDGFKAAMRAYIEALESLLSEILHAIAIALDLPEAYFDRWFTRQVGLLMAIHYPPQQGVVKENLIGAQEHTDFGALTILAQDNQGGLQVRSLDGTWIDAPPVPGAFVVNIGDFMARWTNDVFTSTLHRVINTSGAERYSIAFFREPDHETIVACIPSCIKEGEKPKYPPISSVEYMEERLRKYRAQPHRN
ncbi:isopenicillin N synthase family dioxygenase [Streptomyces sp. NPDC005529]|uniref:isopenicillin N synthase family dioxygenase n=1 Tax=unclassified Streptomyces TaxID=2593676 RepID=UPI0033A931D3